MGQRENLVTPLGRLVQGSLYDPQTTDAEGNPLITKSGPQAGQPKVVYYFALALPKGNEKHWAETPWGQKIWSIGHTGFPNGQANSPTFAWKINDGDSTVPNRAGKKPCDKEGYPGHWVLNFSSGFAPQIVNEDGSAYILERDHINLGDYVQVAGTVTDNGSQQQPGVFLNHSFVAFSRFGKRIVVGVDPKSIGFGKDVVIPAGASLTPTATTFTPPVSAPAAPMQAPVVTAIAPQIYSPPPAYPEILTPYASQVRNMLPPAQGATYEQMIAAGWTDQLLVQHGMMQA